MKSVKRQIRVDVRPDATDNIRAYVDSKLFVRPRRLALGLLRQAISLNLLEIKSISQEVVYTTIRDPSDIDIYNDIYDKQWGIQLASSKKLFTSVSRNIREHVQYVMNAGLASNRSIIIRVSVKDAIYRSNP